LVSELHAAKSRKIDAVTDMEHKRKKCLNIIPPPKNFFFIVLLVVIVGDA